MNLPNTIMLDQEIADLERRAATLNEKIFVAGPATAAGMEANTAFNLVTKRIGELRERRVAVLAGLPDPELVAKAAAVPAARVGAARMPWRMTEKAEAGGRKLPKIEWPLAKHHQVELAELYTKHAEADVAERIEDDFHAVVDQCAAKGLNNECVFTQGMYLAFVNLIAGLQTQLGAIAEFNMLRRREIEGRVAANESRIAMLEARPMVKYLGIYSGMVTYPAGSMVTHRGCVWHANVEIKGIVPGDGASWQLCVQRGRDARDREPKR